MRAQSTDAELVAAAADGERLALAALYDRYAPLLLALANRLLRHQREAEDLLHDVFLEVWRQAGDYDASRGSVRAWLVMRLRSRALDRLKSVRHTRVVSLESTSLPEEPQASSSEQTFGHDQAMVRDALQELPADQRVVLELAYFEGLSLSEIALRLDVPIGTIKSRLARALTRLRDTLRALSDEEGS